MIGSTLIAEKDPSRLATIAFVDDIDDFVHGDLDAMTTIDFEMLCMRGSVAWLESEPVLFDDEGGMATCQVSDAGLSYLLDHAADVPEEYRGDVRKLAEFVAKRGKSHIYELATF